MSELDKTIEDLEAEVSAELAEAQGPKAGAAKGDSKLLLTQSQRTVRAKRHLQKLRKLQNLKSAQPKKKQNHLTIVTMSH